MSSIVKKGDYYYLQKSYKINKKTVTQEKYLGKKIPKKICQIREKFDKEIRDKRFKKSLKSVQKTFNKSYKKISQKEKQFFIKKYAISFTFNSRKLSNSKLSLKDIKTLLNKGIAPQKSINDIQKTKDFYDVFLEILKYKSDINMQNLLFWHKKLLEKTNPKLAGKIRKNNKNISKNNFANHVEIEYLLNELFIWFKKNKKQLEPIEIAAIFHLKLYYIRPFECGNGDMCRIITNFILWKNKWPILDISHKDKKAYFNALKKANKKNDTNYFIEFLIKNYLKNYKKLE